MNKKSDVFLALIIITFIQMGGLINIKNTELDVFRGSSYYIVNSRYLYLITMIISLALYSIIYLFKLKNKKNIINVIEDINKKIDKKFLHLFYFFALISVFNSFYSSNTFDNQDIMLEVLFSNVGYYNIMPILAAVSLNKYINNVHDLSMFIEYKLKDDKSITLKKDYFDKKINDILVNFELDLVTITEAEEMITRLINKKTNKKFKLGEENEK